MLFVTCKRLTCLNELNRITYSASMFKTRPISFCFIYFFIGDQFCVLRIIWETFCRSPIREKSGRDWTTCRDPGIGLQSLFIMSTRVRHLAVTLLLYSKALVWIWKVCGAECVTCKSAIQLSKLRVFFNRKFLSENCLFFWNRTHLMGMYIAKIRDRGGGPQGVGRERRRERISYSNKNCFLCSWKWANTLSI